MALFYTADPERDALEYEDSIERQCEIHEAAQAREHKRLSDAFIDAAPWGPEEPLEGRPVSDAMYDIECVAPGLTDQIVYRAMRMDSDPVWRAMRQEMADAWAEIRMTEKSK